MNKLTSIASLRARDASKHIALGAMGIAALLLIGMNANATASAAHVRSQVVQFEDLELSKPADAKRLYLRLRMAASEVCGGYPRVHTLARNSPRARCEQAAIANAVETIGNSNLTALHLAGGRLKLAQSRAPAASHG